MKEAFSLSNLNKQLLFIEPERTGLLMLRMDLEMYIQLNIENPVFDPLPLQSAIGSLQKLEESVKFREQYLKDLSVDFEYVYEKISTILSNLNKG